ncbi:serine/threonine-protein kinase STN7, chloroplastic-like [Tripterygium wilfordii]|uniref:serine/threonine-protein kinase STN7, chloroplastic-like n=1 Tax=Tripterygium wilfordii TaxID=458696 RepID=UPI0018F808C3|nr:serine/threonine-protein kinase STN7, chloroplastic-like [Tripterygium wilfordii]XP_038707890.1 serine/threonine-protein kinase STN7, chloroplastic-like [Tripterygium wilfordii]
MECGHIIHISTLPKSNGLTLTTPGVLLAVGALSYLWVGVAPGFFDMFVLALVIERLFRPTYIKDDFVLGKKLGDGAFGVVYRVSLAKKLSSKFEGEEDTLADWIQCKEFPFINVETMILGEVLDLPKDLERKNIIIQTIMRHLLFALDGLHSTECSFLRRVSHIQDN